MSADIVLLAHAADYDVVHYHGHLPWVAAGLPAGVPFTQTRHDSSGDCMLKTRFKLIMGYKGSNEAMLAVERGARLVRVHDVAQTVQALKIWQAAQV